MIGASETPFEKAQREGVEALAAARSSAEDAHVAGIMLAVESAGVHDDEMYKNIITKALVAVTQLRDEIQLVIDNGGTAPRRNKIVTPVLRPQV